MQTCPKCGRYVGPREVKCYYCGAPVGAALPTPPPPRIEGELERPGIEGAVIGDHITLKAYYDLRDLRLLLWNLEKELGERYGMNEAIELAQKLRPVIDRKMKEMERMIGRG